MREFRCKRMLTFPVLFGGAKFKKHAVAVAFLHDFLRFARAADEFGMLPYVAGVFKQRVTWIHLALLSVSLFRNQLGFYQLKNYLRSNAYLNFNNHLY